MQFRLTLIALLGTAAVGIAERGTVSAQQEPVASVQARTQWDGVYTEEQAKRGDPLYVKACASCHGPDLAGGEKGPPLAGATFDAIYDGQKMGELSERIRVTMPVDNPGSLSRAQNADILAFMLFKAGAPAGKTSLPTNVDQLNSIKYVAKKPAAN
jgi:mono/diheme cytochrome c family protein